MLGGSCDRVRIMMVVRLRDAETARELTQDAMLAVWRGVRDGQLRNPERLAAFVHGVARNILNNYIRAHAGQPGACTQLRQRTPGSLAIGIPYRNLGAGREKALDDRAADAARPSGDDGHAPVQIDLVHIWDFELSERGGSGSRVAL